MTLRASPSDVSAAHLAPLVPLLVASGAVWSVAQVLVHWPLSCGDHRLGCVVWVVAAAVVWAVALHHDGIAEDVAA